MAYIKKEPIIEFITKGLNNPDKSKAYGYDAIEILAKIEYTPTSDVQEVRHGHWITKDLTPYCSVCHRPSEYECDGSHSKPLFCPNCGSKMYGKEAEAEATEKWNKRVENEQQAD